MTQIKSYYHHSASQLWKTDFFYSFILPLLNLQLPQNQIFDTSFIDDNLLLFWTESKIVFGSRFYFVPFMWIETREMLISIFVQLTFDWLIYVVKFFGKSNNSANGIQLWQIWCHQFHLVRCKIYKWKMEWREKSQKGLLDERHSHHSISTWPTL